MLVSASLIQTSLLLTGLLCVCVLLVALRRARQLRYAQGELEARVAERTADLSTANQFLKLLLDERERMMAEVRESEARFRTMADTAPVMIWAADTEGRRTYFNRVWLQFTGRAVHEELDHGWTVGVHPDDLRTGLVRPQPTSEPQEFIREYRLRRADGAYRWVLEHGAARFHTDGRFAGRIGSAMDITEHKLFEDEIKRLNENLERRVGERTAQLEAANKELEAFSYSVSHDLRTPLRAINGFSRILLEDYAGQLDEEGRRVLDVVCTSAHEMAQLIDDLLAFSRFSRQPLARKEFDMTALIREVCAQIHAPASCPKCQWCIKQLPGACGDRRVAAEA
ncbi:MAG: hypothetical protein DMF64_12720 [Acidobacteria bacterium]|nr:MAG: hypothetical protein DMF64_12720 [Acidobacteriota bacterium]